MGRSKKKTPNQGLPPHRNASQYYRARRSGREGAPSPNVPLLHPNAVLVEKHKQPIPSLILPGCKGRKRLRKPRKKQKSQQQPRKTDNPEVGMLAPIPAQTDLPPAIISHCPSPIRPRSCVPLHLQTPIDPMASIEAPNPPLISFFPYQATANPMTLMGRQLNEKLATVDTEKPSGSAEPGGQQVPEAGVMLPRNEHEPPDNASNSMPLQAQEDYPPIQPTPAQARRTCSVEQASGDLQLQSTASPPVRPAAVPTAASASPEQQTVPQKLNLIEPVGPMRMVFPSAFVRYVLDTTSEFFRHHPSDGLAHQVTAYIDKKDCYSYQLYCGTFDKLEIANEKVMQVFGRDPFQLMGKRYEDMRFCEAERPSQEEDEQGENDTPWTAFSFDMEYPTMRLWARDKQEWSFRVEALTI
ncbi:hypothetical protein F4779DRAFT_637523 [Xylariaceae sp. FL0662B]|nr:hypothetical protein F4779DRAFT_637523 [Xylariaceae sp. FL0662B]